MGRVVYGFADRLEEWFQSPTHHKGRRAWRPNTIRAYRARCKDLQTYFGNRAIKRITTLDVTDFLAESALADNTQLLTVRVLQQFFKHAMQRGWTKINPAKDITFRHKELRRLPSVLEPEEVWALLKAARESSSPKLFPFCCIAFYTGLRSHNIVMLQPKDLLSDWIELDKQQMKAGKPHSVPVHPILRRLAHEVPINRVLGSIRTAFKRAGAAAGLDPVPTIHDLRRTLATIIEQTHSYAIAQALLGHSPGRSITALYVKPTDRQVRQAVLSLPDFTGSAPPGDGNGVVRRLPLLVDEQGPQHPPGDAVL